MGRVTGRLWIGPSLAARAVDDAFEQLERDERLKAELADRIRAADEEAVEASDPRAAGRARHTGLVARAERVEMLAAGAGAPAVARALSAWLRAHRELDGRLLDSLAAYIESEVAT